MASIELESVGQMDTLWTGKSSVDAFVDDIIFTFFSTFHNTKFHSGAPPSVAHNLPSSEKDIDKISFDPTSLKLKAFFLLKEWLSYRAHTAILSVVSATATARRGNEAAIADIPNTQASEQAIQDVPNE